MQITADKRTRGVEEKNRKQIQPSEKKKEETKPKSKMPATNCLLPLHKKLPKPVRILWN
jgi:hypothetical protein